VKKLLLVLAGIAVGTFIFLSAIVGLICLTSANQISFEVANDSKIVLHNVTVIVPGIRDTRIEEMQPTGSFGPAIPARFKVAFRVAFDANGQHYDYPVQVRALPFGLWTVWVHIDDHMQISSKVYGTFRA
jgi:hypothetical protein